MRPYKLRYIQQTHTPSVNKEIQIGDSPKIHCAGRDKLCYNGIYFLRVPFYVF